MENEEEEMKLEELKKIAKARTGGLWKYDWGNWEIEAGENREGICTFSLGTKNDGSTGSPYDGEAIAAVMNHIDELLAVAEAAEEVGCSCEMRCDHPHMSEHSARCAKLMEALKKLKEK